MTTNESLLFEGSPFANAGLAEIVAYLLDRDGINYEVVANEPLIPTLGPPNVPCATQYGPIDPAWLQVARIRDRGLVRYGQRCKVDWFIEQIIRAHPDATVAIATSRASDRDQIAETLCKRGLEALRAFATVPPGKTGRIVVSTWYGLGHLELESWQRTFLLVPNALDAFSTRAQDVLLQSGARFRLFGFLPVEQALSPRERDLLACVYGLHDLVIPAHRYLPRPVGVFCQRFRHAPQDRSSHWNFDNKRALVWKNAARNRLVRRIARPLSERGMNQPNELRAQQAIGQQRWRVRPVTVLTENVDHAVELGALLPDFPILCEPMSLTGLSRRQEQILARARRLKTNAGLAHAISTLGGLSSIRLALTDILVWAGGGIAAPALPAGGLLDTFENRRPLFVIDIGDSGTAWLRRMTDRRRADYERRLWLAPGESASTHAIERFLAQRPLGDAQ
jgi:hypothetical protein